MARALGSLEIGARVKDLTTIYNGVPIIWKVADKNHAGYPANSVTLITDNIITMKCIDAPEPSNGNVYRRERGNNRYIFSNIRSWLNSEATAGAWYTAQHSVDYPPNNAYTQYNPYDTQAGFLNAFSVNFKNVLYSTALVVNKSTEIDGGGYDYFSDKLFLASHTELGATDLAGTAGAKLAMFSDNASRTATPTAQAVSTSNGGIGAVGAAMYWWLRTPFVGSTCDSNIVAKEGVVTHGTYACTGAVGIRPLCNLVYTALVSDTTGSDGCYTMVWNRPPATPAGITIPVTVRGGKSCTVSWGAASDADGNLAGYRLERSVNGGAYALIYQGTALSYSEAITRGWGSIAYRVISYDAIGEVSGYATSATRTIVNNLAPVISGADVALGVKAAAFSQMYTVSDDDGDTVTVIERLDGVQLRSFAAVANAQNTIAIDANRFMRLMNGSHTLTATAADNQGGTSVRTWTFSKAVNKMSVTLAVPISAEVMPTKCIMNVTRIIPDGALFTVEVCNNGFDAVPIWENCTELVKKGSRIFFANAKKTAAGWGFSMRVSVDRAGAAGDCFISGIGGNFE